MERLILLLALVMVAGCATQAAVEKQEPDWRGPTQPSRESLCARRMLLGDFRAELSLLRFEGWVSHEDAARMRELQAAAAAALDRMALALALDEPEAGEAWRESESRLIEACVRMADYVNGLPHQHRTF